MDVPENPRVRVGIDYDAGEVVVFHRHPAGEFPGHGQREIFHGRVARWADLPQPCRQALLEARMVTATGEIV
ncbi:MAG TPA: hypothetical protein VFJ16_20655 [Longimicrobium sp.]|nr:hypothetical protein [Longimicrobium sp.]